MAEAKQAPAAKSTKRLTSTKEPKAKKPEVVETVDAAPAPAAKPIAKAGKRSAKAVAQTKEKQAKEERKVAVKEKESAAEHKPKIVQKVRSKLERRGKQFRKLAEQIEKDKLYTLAEALELATKTSPV